MGIRRKDTASSSSREPHTGLATAPIVVNAGSGCSAAVKPREAVIVELELRTASSSTETGPSATNFLLTPRL
jgi:hypothetical protein